ncbi:MAG: hypothetical protein IPL38_09330 [Rhodobacter sp.]|jgi:hypothetical protein|nr:hypothetical protein [Rhodobacter sp.]
MVTDCWFEPNRDLSFAFSGRAADHPHPLLIHALTDTSEARMVRATSAVE